MQGDLMHRATFLLAYAAMCNNSVARVLLVSCADHRPGLHGDAVHEMPHLLGARHLAWLWMRGRCMICVVGGGECVFGVRRGGRRRGMRGCASGGSAERQAGGPWTFVIF